MSAVLAEVLPASPVAAARAALEAAQGELAALDVRIRGYEQEADEREMALQEHRTATVNAVSAGAPLPKPLKPKPSDAETALPILRGKRKEIVERVDDAQANLRRACVRHVADRCQRAEDTFADAARQLVDAWRELIGTHALLEAAGVRSHPLPPALLGDFNIPVLGKLRPIAPNHALHFLASHELDLGAGQRATLAARRQIERELEMVLPW